MADTFPERFRRVLFERYPDWRQYEIPPDLRWQSEEDLAVEVPCTATPGRPLRIETMSGGIILNWGGTHIHCDIWCGEDTEEQSIRSAFDIIVGTLTEEMAVVLWWPPHNREFNPPSGSWVSIGDLEETLVMARRIIAKDEEFDPERHAIVVRSWLGTYNQGEYPVVPES